MSSYILYDPEVPVITPPKPKRDCTKIVLTDEQQQWLRDHFATTLNKDLAAHFCCSQETVHRWARAMGLKKDPEWFRTILLERVRMMAAANRGEGNRGKSNLMNGAKTRFKKGQTNRERYGDQKEQERILHAAATRRETIRKERMRIRWGLPQETKLRVFTNRKATEARYCMKKAGYIVPGRCAWQVYYDDATRRSPSLEATAQAAGITVQPVNVMRATGS